MAATAPVTCSRCELHAEAVFRVEGMDCQEEVVILERRLQPLAGLEAVRADLVGQRLHVQYDAAKLTTSAMVDAVGETGMRMWLEHEAPVTHGSGVDWRRWRLVSCGALLACGFAAGTAGAAGPAAILYVCAAIAGGVDPLRRALTAVRSHSLDINALMICAVAGAFLLGDWLEAAGVVFLFALAQWLEVRTMERARQAIQTLMDLSPPDALVKRQGEEVRVRVAEVSVGEEIVVRPGEKIPLDGVVVVGHSDVNQAPITGESLPVDKTSGDQVYAGTINGRGTLDVRVARVGRDTRLARIIHLVETARAQRAPIQSFVDLFARRYTPVILLLALATAAIPPLLADAAPGIWLYRALVLLVVACPCALVISTPVSLVAAMSAAARSGVLIKGGAHLERLAGVRAIAFDKTGTLTSGELSVTGVISTSALTTSEILRFAAAVEARSEHPIAQAIVRRARGEGEARPSASAFMSRPGMGAAADVAGVRVVVGNEGLLALHGVLIDEPRRVAGELRGAGKSVVFVAVDGKAAGVIALADRPRPSAREAIELLRAQHVGRIVMLTGDHPVTAKAIASELRVDECYAGLLPEQKHSLIGSLREGHGMVVMVGDGVNDAPALAAADVGVAMAAAGSDAALETADVALMSDELLKLPYAIRLARATLRNVKTNVAISLTLKAAFLVLAVSGQATLWMAVLADTGASVIVVANALRLLRAR